MIYIKTQFKVLLISLFLSASAWADLSGDWEGELDVNGTKIPLVIHLLQNDEHQSGTLDSPAQGANDIAMTSLEFNDEKLMFEIAGIGIHYEGELDQATGNIDGNFIQGGVFKLSFSPVSEDTFAKSDSSDDQDLLGQWGGTVEIPGNPLGLILHVNTVDGALTATADSPDQGATGMVVDTITLQEGKVVFTMEALGVEFIGTMGANKGVIKGDFNQQGMVFKLQLTRDLPQKQVSERPQEPQEPFAYHIETVVVHNNQANIELAGTLTRPSDANNVKAAAIMITGSGPQDRDETIFNHKPFWIIADYLAEQGYAVLRLDDRGVGESTGDFNQATSEDFVTDISAAVDFLKLRADIPADKIGLIGHSEGGMIAPMLAAQRDDLSFLVLLAGP
ncbi:MAG: alpha/beta hydrolase family protein, partial [Marinicella sp.]